jgi:hypothetical protein
MLVMSEAPVVELDHETRLLTLAGQLKLINAHLVEQTAELLDTGRWNCGGHRTPAAYLAWAAGLSPERVALIVRVAERHGEFPVLIDAFDRGELSLEQVAECVKAPAWADAEVAEFARIATVGKLRRAMRSNMFIGDPDEPESQPAPPRDRLSFGPTGDGRWRIRGELGLDDGLRVEAAIAERRDAMFSDGDEDVTYPEAFVDCFDRSVDAVESSSRRDRYRTWLHVDVTSGVMTSTAGWRIPMALRQHLLCDGVVQPVWERDGVPFSVGRDQRIVPDRTRRIIERRDRGCRVPGCDRGRFVEIHHIVHWLDGGTTDTSNLISLCPPHHRLHHQGRLGIAGDADRHDDIIFSDEHGRVIGPRGQAVTTTGPTPQPAAAYTPPLNGRFDWYWINPWIHPSRHLLRRRPDAA